MLPSGIAMSDLRRNATQGGRVTLRDVVIGRRFGHDYAIRSSGEVDIL